jgi:hypothetical protein
MEKQTAVEWLEFEINRRGPKENNPPQWLKELYEQAKEMEKQQLTDFYCHINPDDVILQEFAEQHYNKIFNK